MGKNLIFRSIAAGTLSIIVAIIVFSHPPSVTEIAKAGHDQPSYVDRLTDPVSIFTFFLVISNGLLWLTALDQSRKMGASIREAGRAATAMEGVAASLAQSTASTQEIIQNQKTYAAMQLRAYVSPQGVSLYEGTILKPPVLACKDTPGIVLIFRNSGHTPARRVTSWAQIDVVEVANENALTIPVLDTRFASGLSSGGEMTKVLWYDRPLTPGEINDIKTGVRAIYVHGRIEYFDCFDTPQFSNFRLRYIGDFPPPEGVIFNHCQNGNDAS